MGDPQAPKPITLARKLLNASESIGAIGKNGVNQAQRFNFQSWEDVVPAVRKACIEQGIMLLISAQLISAENVTTSRGNSTVRTRASLRLRVVDVDSSEEIGLDWIGEADDSADKGMQKAMTSGYKYLLLKLFLVPCKEDADPDAGTPVERDDRANGRAPEPRRDVRPMATNAHVDQAEDRPPSGRAANPRQGGARPSNVQEAMPKAFGYAPPQWPAAKAMAEPATENQFRHLRGKADQRHLSERELVRVRETVLREFGVEDGTKGALSLLIDFLTQAGPASLDAARGVRRAG